MTQPTQNYINHVALVLDASSSMRHLANDVVKVADNQIKHLAQRSQELDQETRVTVYSFADHHKIKCLFYDKDVLRLPSMQGLYVPNGNTALVAATMLALNDLKQTAQLYGDHAFLIYVLTDGEENDSHRASPPVTSHDLARRLKDLPENWTLGTFVPNATGVHEAKKFGFAQDNIAVWNTSAAGVREVGETIRQATDNFMRARAAGVRGSRNLFTMDMQNLSKSAVQRLPKLAAGQFRMYEVKPDDCNTRVATQGGVPAIEIAEFVETKTHRRYVLGEAFYQLTVPVKVQPQKEIALYHKKEHAVYLGPHARTLLGLPDHEVKVQPDNHQDFDIFIQSTSTNRKVLEGQHVLVVPARA